ncbi:MAG: chemotaxis protein CheB, partial [Bradymonadaceae bacterium]
MIFIVAQHLAPDKTSRLTELLQETTGMEADDAADGMTMQPDHVYVLPPDSQLSIDDNQLRLREMPELKTGRHTIDFLFRSL